MHAHEKLLTGFYTAFSRQDAAPMRAAYGPEAHFSDPAFPELRGAAVGDMWAMLCQQAKDFRLEFRDVKADDSTGSAHWEAWYRFGGKRKVHNVIDAKFTFRDGKIIRHVDTFDLHRWASMALGLKGKLLGWLPPVQDGIRKKAAAGLDAYLAKRA